VKPSLRFLALAVIGWAGMRAFNLGVLPSADFLSIDRSEAKTAPPPIAPTEFPALEPVAPPDPPQAQLPEAPAAMSSAAPVRYVQGVVGVPVAMARGVVPVYQLPPPSSAAAPDLPPRRTRLAGALPEPTPAVFSQLPPLDEWPVASLAAMSRAGTRSTTIPAQSTPVDPHRIDRLQLSTWALLRGQQSAVAGSRSLATGGQLGASQAGARLVYNLDRRIALTARTSSEVGRRGGEVAGGVRVQPLSSIPVWLTAERRQAIGRYGGGRSAFALFLEGGLYQQPLPGRFSLDTYLQGGVVGLHSRDLFVDGGLTVTRPVYRQFSAGFGVWGGAQPSLYRIDAGPRLTMRVRSNVKVHVDWRQTLAGNALPGSGPVLTLAGDF
jgi:hypothetical protein